MSIFSQRLERFFSKLRAPRAGRAPASPRRTSRGGFTLIELLVVTLIMMLITSTILVRQARFNSATLLRSLSYSIALTIRSAQVYGTSVRGTQTGGTTVFAPAYGAYFSGQNSYLLFADVNNDGAYNAATDAVVQTYQVGAGFRISKFCATLASSGAQRCSTDAGSPLTSLVIYFKRPNPDALFRGASGDLYSEAYIQVSSASDSTNTHAIEVTSTGEISVLPAGS